MQPNYPNNQNNPNNPYQRAGYPQNQQQYNNPNQNFSNYGQQGYQQPNPHFQGQSQSFPTNPRNKGTNQSQQSFISTNSAKTNQMSTYSQQRLLQQRMRINPKQNNFKQILVNDMPCPKGFYLTNLFGYATQQNYKVYMYKVQTIPPIKPDATKTWYRVINSIKFQLQREIKMITFRGDTIWAELNKPNFGTTANLQKKKKPQQMQQQPEQPGSSYNVYLTLSGAVSFEQMYEQTNKSLKPLFIQMVNTNIKQKLSELGYEQLGKGKFYNRSNIASAGQTSKSKYGLNVVSGFRFTLCCFGPLRNYMQIDLSTRILRTRNLYEQIMAAVGTQNDKIMMFRGATVITRYGNYRTYKIDSIEYNLNINSVFEARNNNGKQKISFKQYYESHYQVKINFDNQPLVSAIAKTEKKIGKGQKMTKEIQKIYLIPELVSLTGLDQKQRENQPLMQQIAQATRSQPNHRIQMARRLASLLKEKNVQIGEPVRMEGYKLLPPSFSRSKEQFKRNPYALPLMQELKPMAPFEIKYDDFVVFFTQRTQGDKINTLCNFLATASNTYRIAIPEYPKLICVEKSSDKNTTIKNMFASIDNYCSGKTLEQKTNTLFFFVLDNSQQTIYDALKNYTLRKHQIISQMILTQTLSKQGAGLSIAGKIGLQIAAKKGFAIWEVNKMHPYWKNKRIASSSMSYSKSTNGDFTLGFVGTTNNSQTKVYSYCSVKIPRKEAVAPQVLTEFYRNWIWQYRENEKALPNTLIIYREGLSEAEINKRVTGELQCLEEIIFKEIPTWNPNYENYSPEIIFLIVNKNVRSRFYDVFQIQSTTQNSQPKLEIKNPTSGSVIYCTMANNNEIDFFLVPQKTDVGTVTPTQYKLAYYHPEKTEKNSGFQNTQLPLQAIAQFTFQQCFNYYNWDGVVKLPGVLQYAHKLAKMAGEHIREPINLNQFMIMVKAQGRAMAQNTTTDKQEQIKAFMVKKSSACQKILNSFYFL